uniref:Tail tape measure protein n=1 Tax=virus sp. ctqEG8 TaxID=2827998 RepID=A0A8S5REK3_9VIRU|nr:MAG TPA: tail tape measure protein [virus sp. ctqEG8]
MADELGFEISAKVDKALTALGQLNYQFSKLGDTVSSVTKTIASSQFGQAIKGQVDQVSDSFQKIKDAKTSADAAMASAKANPATYEQVKERQEQINDAFRRAKSEATNLKAQMAQLMIEYRRVSIEQGITSDSAQSVASEYNALGVQLDAATKKLDRFKQLKRAVKGAVKDTESSLGGDNVGMFGGLSAAEESMRAAEQLAAAEYQRSLASQTATQSTNQASTALRFFSRSANDATGAVKKNDTFFAQLSRSIKNITFYRLVRGAIKSIMNAAIQATQAMAIWSQQFDTGATGSLASFNDNVSSIASNMLFMRNAIMAAVEPIISLLTPAFNMLASAIANAFNMLSQFLSALTGRSFYNKAIKNNVNYANSLKQGSKAQKAFLAGFDELEVVQEKQGKTAGEALGIDPGSMWSQEQVTPDMEAIVSPLKKAWQDALDNMKSIWDAHKDGLLASAQELFSAIGNLMTTIDISFLENFFGEGRVGAQMFADALWFLDNAMQLLASIINNILAPAADGFIQGFSDSLGVIWGIAEDIFGPILEKIFTLTDYLNQNSDAVQSISQKIGYVIGVIAPIVGTIMLISGAVKVVAGVIGAAIPVIAAIKTAISLVGIAVAAVGGPLNMLILVVGAVALAFIALYKHSETFRNFVNGVGEGIKEMVNGFIDAAGAIIDGFIKGIVEGVPRAIKEIVEWAKEIPKRFKEQEGIHSPSTVFAEIGNMLVLGLVNGIRAFFGKVTNVIGDIKKKCDLSSLVNDALTWGKDMMKGFADGISKAKDAVGNAIHTVADKITSLLHFSRPDEGPLRSYEQWMPDFMRGLANGIDDNSNLVYAATGRLAAGMQSALSVPTLGIGNVNGSVSLDASSVSEAQMSANQAMADVFWKGCMAVVQAINNKDMEVSIGDDVIGRAASRYERKQAVIHGGAY